MSNKKAIILGAGSIGKRHAKNLIKKNIEVTFVRRKVDHEFDSEFGSFSITWEEFLNNNSNNIWDFGFICTPTNNHINDINQIHKRVKKIFLEKPLSSDYSSLLNICDSVDPNKLFIGFMMRFHPNILYVKNKIQKFNESIIGGTFHFGSYMPKWHPKENYKTSYAANKEMGGGVVRTICHELDLVLWFFGDPKHVYAQYNNFSKLSIDCEELAFIQLTYKSFIINIELNYLEKNYNRFFNLYLSDSSISWNWNKSNVIENKNNISKILNSKSDFNLNCLYEDELNFFLLNENFDDNNNLNYAKKIQYLIHILDKSNKLGKKINYDWK